MTDTVVARDAMRGLKDFQRRSVDNAFERLWGSEDPVSRFLVADEVGLGKTLVARGLVARTIEHLQRRGEKRIDIVYICSNRQIAQQNLRRLHDGVNIRIPHADRLTLLPKVLHKMNERSDDGSAINIISLTPATSFDLRSSGGVAGERALLHVLLEGAWGREAVSSPKWGRFFQGGASERRMRWEHRWGVDRSTLTEDLVRTFRDGLTSATFGRDAVPLVDALRDGVDQFDRRKHRRLTNRASTRRYALLGQLRRVLAEACVGHLDPDLVILDEFQRFGSLLHGSDDAAILARHLLGDERIDAASPHTQTRVLLLSATPFKMYTLPDEPEGDDHYKDFTRTVSFLAGPEHADTVRRSLKDMRTALLVGDSERAVAAKDVAEGELRRVMSRTERLAVSSSRDGMLSAFDALDVTLTPDDVRDYVGQARVARALGTGDMLEFWRSTPYALELMDQYQVKKKIKQDLDAGAPLLSDLLLSRIRHEDIGTYAAVDPGNPKLRWLTRDVVDSGAWRVAWLPPALPYYSPDGAYAQPNLRDFTKRLIFSSWAVAPKGIATMLSYEVERLLVEGSPGAAQRDYFGARRTGLLAFNRSDGRLSGMPVLGLMYPSRVLAEFGDPLAVARDLGATLPLDRVALHQEVRGRVERALERLPAGSAAGTMPSGAWFWAAPLLLDRVGGHTSRVGDLPFGAIEAGDGEDGSTVFRAHLDEATGLDPDQLGARPPELVDVLTELAIAGPGVCSLRALQRVLSSPGEDSAGLQGAASSWAWALRNLFNTPEIMAMLQAGESTYWRQVLQHCVDGNLQAVLDEYAEVLVASLSLRHEPLDKQLEQLVSAFADGSGLRAASQAVDHFGPEYDGHVRRDRIRSHFAVRYGRHAAEDDKTMLRESRVRDAFNSPFWPFVLASTSVGQEGLDFHHYSHSVVHWNLPSNPVDMEQREGRVHRYRGHAVRKNVARTFGARREVVESHNPWEALFRLATASRDAEDSEIVPDWVFPADGGATIERYVPSLPMSRERQHYRRLLRTMGAYRLTLGHPRQSDLLAYVGTHSDLALDLAP
ncbi:helicase-related protein [Ornithinimicrobium sp. LYQ121]|uniref:helicase-related protein n=1 Tax=Ornithinimicrobium sp. LYQ121 TaxID=3378801 RepID=UPI0038523DFE